MAPKNPLPKDYQDHLARYIPVLRSYQLNAAADHFEQWLNGELQLAPLLDISGSIGFMLFSLILMCQCGVCFNFIKFHCRSNLRTVADRCFFQAGKDGQALHGVDIVKSFEPKPNPLK